MLVSDHFPIFGVHFSYADYEEDADGMGLRTP